MSGQPGELSKPIELDAWALNVTPTAKFLSSATIMAKMRQRRIVFAQIQSKFNPKFGKVNDIRLHNHLLAECRKRGRGSWASWKEVMFKRHS